MTGHPVKCRKSSASILFSPGGVVLAAVIFFGGITALNGAAWQLCMPLEVPDCPRYWPVSIFMPRHSWTWEFLPAFAAYASALGMIRNLKKNPQGILWLFFSGLFLMFLSNAAQGFGAVLTQPIAGSWNQYYHDALRITHAFDFISHFNLDQQGLLTHSRTHPPGAVLLVYGLLKIIPQPWFVAVSFASLGTAFSVFFLSRILKREFDAELSVYGVFLFLVLPSVQIYYLASLDAVIAGLSLGAVFFFITPRRDVSFAGTFVCLFFVSFLTFGFLFFLPVFAGWEWLKKRSLRKAAALTAGLCAAYGGLYFFTGFNYFKAFQTASLLENPNGFRLLSEPVNYLLTRFACIFEILLFSGPLFILAAAEGFLSFSKRPSDLMKLSLLALGSLAAMLFLGVYETGETARVCLYFYPFLLFPVLKLMQNRSSWASVRFKLAGMVFFQTLVMQLVGNYFW